MQIVKVLVALAVIGLVAGTGFVCSGVYDVGADEPHWPVTSWLMTTLRDRSIGASSRGIAPPPDLDSTERVRRGAGNYEAMCAGCHLAPGTEDSEVRQGLYPQPPNLAAAGPQDTDRAARRFWIIKHGIKMSGMPAWSRAGVDDETIWDMVALLRRLPALKAEEYGALVQASEGHAHEGHPHDHEH